MRNIMAGAIMTRDDSSHGYLASEEKPEAIAIGGHEVLIDDHADFGAAVVCEGHLSVWH